MSVTIERVYDHSGSGGGRRVLVDRVWPRGVSKAKAGVDLWLKDVGPSTELRQWFGHAPERWAEFRRRYRAELAANPAFVELRALADGGDLTLVYSARDREHNQAVVLAELLSEG